MNFAETLRSLVETATELVDRNRTAAYAAAGAAAALLVVALLLGSGEEETDVSLAGSWEVSYADRVLGAVGGRAIVSENEDEVTVRLVHPLTGARFALRSTAFAREGDTLNVTLQGEGPSIRNFVDPVIGEALDVGEGTPYGRMGPDRIVLSMGEATTTITAREPDEASRQEIVLSLTIGDGTLAGTWSQIVHPETGRDEDGSGRIGDFRFFDDGSGRAEQSGFEAWSRPNPVIRLVMPHADQYARARTGDAAYPYPWNAGGALVSPFADRRYLLVIGEDLPTELGEEVIFTSSSPGITYNVEAKPPQLEGMVAAPAMVEAAWKRIEDDLRRQMLSVSPGGTVTPAAEATIAQSLRELRELDFILVRAELAQGAAPGRTSFTLNGAEGTWALRYGDVSGSLTFARPMPSGPDEAAISEPLDYAYAPDKVYLEIRTTNELPFESLPMQVWVNDRPRLFSGSRELVAVRLPITDADRENLEYRRERVRAGGGDPAAVRMVYTYRSPALALVPAGAAAADAGNVPGVVGDYRIPVNTGDVVRGVFGSPDKFLVTPAVAEIRVSGSPAEVSQLTLGPDADNNLTWPRAVTLAAACVNVELAREPDDQGNPTGPLDFYATARARSQTFTNVIVLAGTTANLDMSVGDHAAMLMLRDVFIEMMTRQARNIESIDTPAEIAAFRAQSEVPVSNVPNHPLAAIEVPTPGGNTIPFELTYASDDVLNGSFGLTLANIDEWRQTATVALIAEYLAQIRRSLVLAQEIDICADVDDLIELTGKGFDGVYRYALGRLVTAEATALAPGEYWKPDLAARAYLIGVPILANALSAQEDYSAADTRAIVTATAIATSAVAVTGGLLAVGATYLGAAEATGFVGSLGYSAAVLAEAGSALAFASDFIAAGFSTGSAIAEKYESTAEVTFARGTALTIGMTRLDQAIENDRSYARLFSQLYLELAPVIVGAAFSVDDAVRAVANFGEASSLSRTTRNITEGGLRPLAQENAVARGRELLGDVPTEATVVSAARPLAAVEPPRIPADEFAEAFPDAQRMQGAGNLGLDDLRDPANPNTLRSPEDLANNSDAVLDAAGLPPPGAFEGADTIIPAGGAAAPPAGAGAAASPFPPGGGPPPGFEGSGTNIVTPRPNAGTPPAPRSVDEIAGIRTQVDEIFENARAEAQAVFEAGGELGGLQVARLEGDAQLYMVQGLLEDAVAEARRAGLSDLEIDGILAARAGMENPTAARYALVRDLEYAAVQRLGYEILSPQEGAALTELLTRAVNTAADAAPISELDLTRLKQWIDNYTVRGRDFFEELQRMGTFSDFVDDVATMNPGAGFEAIASADDIAILRRLAEDNDLLPDFTDTAVLNARRAGEAQVENLADVRALPEADRVAVFAAMTDARRIALEVGEGALDAVERSALRIANEAFSEGAETLPDWARGLDRATYDIIEPLSRRADIRAFVAENPAVIGDIARDPDGLSTLSRQPYNSLEELTEAVRRERERIKQPVAGFYEQTSRTNFDPDKVVLKDDVFNMRDFDPDHPDVQMSTTKILIDDVEVGAFQRELEFFDLPGGGEGRQMVFSYAHGKHAPRFLTDVAVPLTPRGAPLATFMNVRAFQNLGVGFADPSLLRVKMSNVINVNTSIEIDWMRRVYGENYTNYLHQTHSVRYAESALHQAGYRITGVRIDGGIQARAPARALVRDEFFNAVEPPDAFLARFGVAPEATLETGFDIYIDIAPF